MRSGLGCGIPPPIGEGSAPRRALPRRERSGKGYGRTELKLGPGGPEGMKQGEQRQGDQCPLVVGGGAGLGHGRQREGEGMAVKLSVKPVHRL